ncbi:MAG: hypothetical protein ACREA0_05600, partial [bacterium]
MPTFKFTAKEHDTLRRKGMSATAIATEERAMAGLTPAQRTERKETLFKGQVILAGTPEQGVFEGAREAITDFLAGLGEDDKPKDEAFDNATIQAAYEDYVKGGGSLTPSQWYQQEWRRGEINKLTAAEEALIRQAYGVKADQMITFIEGGLPKDRPVNQARAEIANKELAEAASLTGMHPDDLARTVIIAPGPKAPETSAFSDPVIGARFTAYKQRGGVLGPESWFQEYWKTNRHTAAGID